MLNNDFMVASFVRVTGFLRNIFSEFSRYASIVNKVNSSYTKFEANYTYSGCETQ